MVKIGQDARSQLRLRDCATDQNLIEKTATDPSLASDSFSTLPGNTFPTRERQSPATEGAFRVDISNRVSAFDSAVSIKPGPVDRHDHLHNRRFLEKLVMAEIPSDRVACAGRVAELSTRLALAGLFPTANGALSGRADRDSIKAARRLADGLEHEGLSREQIAGFVSWCSALSDQEIVRLSGGTPSIARWAREYQRQATPAPVKAIGDLADWKGTLALRLDQVRKAQGPQWLHAAFSERLGLDPMLPALADLPGLLDEARTRAALTDFELYMITPQSALLMDPPAGERLLLPCGLSSSTIEGCLLEEYLRRTLQSSVNPSGDRRAENELMALYLNPGRGVRARDPEQLPRIDVRLFGPPSPMLVAQGWKSILGDAVSKHGKYWELDAAALRTAQLATLSPTQTTLLLAGLDARGPVRVSVDGQKAQAHTSTVLALKALAEHDLEAFVQLVSHAPPHCLAEVERVCPAALSDRLLVDIEHNPAFLALDHSLRAPVTHGLLKSRLEKVRAYLNKKLELFQGGGLGEGDSLKISFDLEGRIACVKLGVEFGGKIKVEKGKYVLALDADVSTALAAEVGPLSARAGVKAGGGVDWVFDTQDDLTRAVMIIGRLGGASAEEIAFLESHARGAELRGGVFAGLEIEPPGNVFSAEAKLEVHETARFEKGPPPQFICSSTYGGKLAGKLQMNQASTSAKIWAEVDIQRIHTLPAGVTLAMLLAHPNQYLEAKNASTLITVTTEGRGGAGVLSAGVRRVLELQLGADQSFSVQDAARILTGDLSCLPGRVSRCYEEEIATSEGTLGGEFDIGVAEAKVEGTLETIDANERRIIPLSGFAEALGPAATQLPIIAPPTQDTYTGPTESYTVAAGDTLVRILKRRGLVPEDFGFRPLDYRALAHWVAKMNGIAPDLIKVGQKLALPKHDSRRAG